jgi:probable HAF family extracellular repeat protein
MNRLLAIFILTICLIIIPAITAMAAVEYTVTYLGTYQGHYLRPLAMNNLGDVVGAYQYSGNQAAFFYHNGQVESINFTNLYDTWAFGINDNQIIVGSQDTVNGNRGLLYRNGTTTLLPTLGGRGSAAIDINSQGEIVGSSSLVGDIISHAFIFRNGAMIDLGTLGSHSFAQAINDQGVVAGYSYAADNTTHLFRYENNQMIDLGKISDVYTEDINNLSQIVGASNSGAFFHDGTHITYLGSFDNKYSRAMAINDQSWIVGYSSVSVPSVYRQHAFLYRSGKMIDLNSLIDPNLGLELYQANDINNNGQIIVEGTGFKSYLLTPIPEPSSLLLLALAVPGIVYCWRLSRR